MNRLLQMLNGRRIAIVGNSAVQHNFSQEIDSADVVIRFNHFYNYDSGLVGKRVDMVFQTVAQAWNDAVNQGKAHIDIVQEQKPEIFLIKRPDHYDTSVHGIYGKGIRVNNVSDWFKPWWQWTTGTCALCWLAQNLTNAKVKVYGFSNDGLDTWEQYSKTDAKHYGDSLVNERPVQIECIQKLMSLEITNPLAAPIPRAIVIPVKANSEGAPKKNHKLLLPCLKKVVGKGYPVYVVGDDYELLHKVQKEYKDKVFLTALPKIDAYDDVTKTLRNWQVETGFSGDIALVQCTSPYLDYEWITQCFDNLKYSPLVATAVPLEFKATAIYREENGVFIPSSQALPAASVARQLLPRTVRITGAVECFHTDALSNESLYNVGIMYPVIVDNAVDIDTEEQLKNVKL